MPGEVTQIPNFKPDGHILSINMKAWGHTVASINLVSKIVRCKPVYITIAVVDTHYDKAIAMLGGLFSAGNATEKALRALIRVTKIAWVNLLEEAEAVDNYRTIFKAAYEAEPIPAHTGSAETLPVAPKVKLVISDFLLLDSLRAIREIAGPSIKVYAVQSCAAAGLLKFGPKEEGKPGAGDLSELVESIMAEGLGFAEAHAKIDQVYRRRDGVVFYHAGLPSVYDYELLPQKSTMHFSMAVMMQQMQKFFKECDGVIHGTSDLLEKDAIAEFGRVFRFAPEVTICAGPFAFPMRPASWDIDLPSASEARALLDRALEERGANSVIYVSLGSTFWTTEPEKVWTIINTLLDRDIHLLFSHAPPAPTLPDDLKARLDASEIAFCSAWLPQTQILEHEACGWFLTHCGENSYCETLSAGVPVICMPLAGDQVHNAIYATDVYHVGYEIYNARNGPGVGPIHRKDDWAPEGTVQALQKELEEILDKAFGEDGNEKRKNAQKYQALLRESWKEGGESWKELERLFELVV